MNEHLEFLGVLAGMVLGTAVLIVAVAIGLEYGLERPACYAEWRDSGFQVRWSLYGDCQLSTDGKIWITDKAAIATHKIITIEN